MGFCKNIGEKKYLIKYDVPPSIGKSRKLKTETLKGVTRAQAEAILANRKHSAQHAEHIVDNAITFENLYKRFIGQKRAAGKSPTTSSDMTVFSESTCYRSLEAQK